jgi:ABC-2 type transport system ATP-binding protein
VSALAARGLEKRYGSTTALAGVDVDVAEGELVGLLGPNGAGKSTLVKIACGLVRPTRGQAEVCGAKAGSLASRRKLGYLAELFRFPDWLTADELLAMHQRLAQATGGAEERERLLAAVGLTEASARRIGAMSKGMQQRLGIAQAMIGDPRVLLLDEPTSGLDLGHQVQVLELVEELRRTDRITVLSAMHDLTLAARYADHIALVVDGELVADGAPEDVFRAELLERHYGVPVHVLRGPAGELIIAPAETAGTKR